MTRATTDRWANRLSQRAALSPGCEVRALSGVLSENEEVLLLKAGIYRELGRFADCLDIPKRITRQESQKTVQKLCALCEGKDTEV